MTSNDLARIRANAEAALEAGRLEEASRLCQSILDSDPENCEATLLYAVVTATKGDIDTAAALFRQALQLDANAYDALIWLAAFAQKRGEPAEAVELAQRAVVLRPSESAGHQILGRSLLTQGEAEKALRHIQMGLETEPDSPVALYLLGKALEHLGKSDEAIAAYQKSIRVAPRIIDAHIALAQTLHGIGRRAEAAASFRTAYKLEPNSARGITQLGKALSEEGRLADAETALQRAVSLNPNSAVTLATLGHIQQMQGEFTEAESNLRRATEAQPRSARPYLNWFQCRKLTELDRPIIESLESMTKEPQRSLDDLRHLHYALGKAFNDLGEFDKAMQHYHEANRAMLRIQHAPFRREEHVKQFDFWIQNLNAEFLSAHENDGNKSRMPIFIVGMIRSGTTLVEQILSSHPDIGAAGELMFWLQNHARAVDAPKGEIHPEAIAGLASQYFDLLSNSAPGKRRVTDKMPLNFMFTGLLHWAFPQAKIIHCRRNPVDTCLSMYMTPFTEPIGYGHDLENLSFYYKQYQRLMSHWRSVLPADQFIEVDYEGLVASRESETRRLLEFIGLAWSDNCLRPESNERPVSTPSMWQVRQPVYSTSVGRWRSYEPWIGPLRELLH